MSTAPSVPHLSRMSDRVRRGLRIATAAARDAGLKEVTMDYLVAGMIASGGMATTLVVNLKLDLSSLPQVNFALPGEQGKPLIPFDAVCHEVFAYAANLTDHWNLIGQIIGTDAIVIAALIKSPKTTPHHLATSGEILLGVAWTAAITEVYRLLGWDGLTSRCTLPPEPKTGFEEVDDGKLT